MLGYESIKIVLQYMEANLRFKLTHRLPSIRTAEKLVPLKIESLSLPGDYEFWVNKTQYTLKTLRINPWNDLYTIRPSDGVYWDWDPYGIEKFSTDQPMTPGDIVIRGGVPFGDHRRNREADLTDRIRRLEREQARGYNPYMSFIGHLEQIQNEGQIQLRIDHYNRALQPYRNRRLGIPANFVKMYQLVIKSMNRRTIEMWRRPGTIGMHEVEKKILEHFFGGRACVPLVKHLEVEGHVVIRFPLNFKIKVRKLRIELSASENCDTLREILEDVPLQVFETSLAFDNVLSHQIIRNAETLVLHKTTIYLFNQFLALPFKKVEIIENELSPDRVADMVRNWQRSQREVGHCYKFEMWQEDHALTFMRIINVQCNGTLLSTNKAIVPVNVTSEIHVAVTENPTPRLPHQNWVLKIEVVEI